MIPTNRIISSCLILLVSLSTAFAQQGEVLNENDFFPVPNGMSYEEYRDANRRLLPAVLVAGFAPLPGMMHFQAGESRTGWMLAGAAVTGGLAIVGGISTGDENGYVDTDYSTVDINNIRYERIPIRVEDDGTTTTTTYDLRKLKKDQRPSDLGMALIVLGGTLLAADYLYDWVHGIHVIQEKRDRVRYKYGQQLKLGLEPQLNLENGTAGMKLALTF
ncbi:hypothetical protein KQI63_16760 [bacterium]|nr:hypothetical protein [bacterium]